MKCTVIIDKEREEEVIVYAKEENETVKKIKELSEQNEQCIIGYGDGEILPLDISRIYLFTTEAGKIYAVMKNKKYRIRERLYELEGILPDNFIKINQSTLANTMLIKRFDASVLGCLTVEFKNGYRDYVSRRQMRAVKEKYGIK